MDDLTADSAAILAEALTRLGGQAPREAPEPRTSSAPEVGGYEQAASVLGWFDPETLRPAGTADRSELKTLLGRAVWVTDDQGERRRCIRARRRVKVLRHLREQGQVERALDANKAPAGDLLHALIRSFARGQSVKLTGPSLAELHSIALVCDWLREAGYPKLPAAPELQDRIDQLALLEPLELLVDGFVGREAELKRLRRFVLGPADGADGAEVRHSRSKAAARKRDAEDPTLSARMLVLHGPAGIGKSTLLARFLLDLAGSGQQDADGAVPFAYLDFDRPAVDSSNPLSILREAWAQIAVRVPQARESYQPIGEEWTAVLEQEHVSRTFAMHVAERDFGTLVESLKLGTRPLLLVLDTFEVVQYRSSEEVAAILKTLDRLVAKVPALRVIVAGRAGIPRPYASQMEIPGLDHAAAIEFLTKQGVTDSALAERIASRYARDPQSLRLAAVDPDAHHPLIYLLGRAAEWFQQLDAAVIQRKLYERILGHIHSPDVKALANPGLVIRRVTPEIVLEVLAGPCCLPVRTLAEAARLCVELRRETSLVAVDSDGALVHRPELRRTMLPLIETDQPVVSLTLHRRAVAYYVDRPADPRERAEEIYHRLKCGDPVETVADRWIDGVQRFLTDSLGEFRGAQRAFLAAQLGTDLDPGTAREARLEDWERLTERKVRAMLDDDRPRDALTVLASRRERLVDSSLIVLEAEAHFRLGQVEQAIGYLGDAADADWLAGRAAHAFQLSRLESEFVLSAGSPDQVASVDRRLQFIEQHTSDRMIALACSAYRAAMAQRVAPETAPEIAALAGQRFDALPDEMLAADPSLVWLTASLSSDSPARLARAVLLAGLPTREEGPVRVIAAEAAGLDVSISARYGERPGALARRYGIGEARSLTAAWSAFLLSAEDGAVRSVLCDLLGRDDPGVSQVAKAVARALGSELVLRWVVETPSGPEPDVTRHVALTPDVRGALAEVITAHFAPDALRWFLRLRLRLSLSALVPGAQDDYLRSVGHLVAALEDRGLLVEFVAHCRDVAPGDPRLLRVAEMVGLGTPLTADVDTIEQRVSTYKLDFQTWLTSLGQLEGQVCRVDGAGSGGTGFLVGADLVLTSTAVLDGARLNDLRCLFDAKVSQDGRLVTPGAGYPVREIVASQLVPDAGGWLLMRVAGSPGVQPRGGDAVESETGMLRGWVDVTHDRPVSSSRRLLLLGAPPPGGPRMELAWADRSLRLDDHRLRYDLASLVGFEGAPVLSVDLIPVGLHLGSSPDPARPDVGVAISLGEMRARLAQLGLDDLLGTNLA